MITAENLFQLFTDSAVQPLNVLNLQALAVRWICDENTFLGRFGDILQGTSFQFDVASQSSVLDVLAGDGNGFTLDVATVNLVIEFAFTAVVIVDLGKQIGVIVVPQLESVLLAEHPGVDVGGYHGGLDQEGAASAHGVNKIGVAVPPTQFDDACGEHLVDGSIGLCYAPSAAVQWFAARVKRQDDFGASNVHVKANVGVGQANGRPFVVSLTEEVGNGIFHAVSDET